MLWVREHATARWHLSTDAGGQRLRCGVIIPGSPFVAADLTAIGEMGGGTACLGCLGAPTAAERPAPTPALMVAARLLDAARSSLGMEERRAFVDLTRREFPEAFADVERANTWRA